ncbi:MAG: DNA polymerase/3'-5' exonuclease PolX [Acidobacteriota bacterium]
MDNANIIRVLRETAALLEIQGANPFRIRAYRNAVHTLQDQTVPLARRLEEGEDLTALDGIGKEMARHIAEVVETGELTLHEDLLAEIPRGVLEVRELSGVGPKKAARLWRELGVTDLPSLEAAAQDGKVGKLSGFGLKSEAKILDALEKNRRHRGRFRLADADAMVEPLLAFLRTFDGLERVEAAGSLRRRKDTVGDIDLLAITQGGGGPLIEHFVAYGEVESVAMAGDTRASVTLKSGLSVDLRVLQRENYGAALVYFTGSKEHNVKLRQRAVERGLKVSEYGVFRQEEEERPTDGERIGGAEEREIYQALDLVWIPPELREDRGELKRAAEGELPRLLEPGDLKGDLHMHSTWSDGSVSLAEMVAACAERGYDYMAIADHSASIPIVTGMDGEKLRRQWKEIDEIESSDPGIRVLKSMEVDILEDGSLDLDEESLALLDLVIASVHGQFDLPRAVQTRRLIKALSHPQVNILGHATARSIPKRPPMELDLDEVLRCAAEHRVAVEINSRPRRLDLPDVHVLRAKELGVKMVISTDAHRPTHLDLISYGVEQARRAWLGPDDVLTTRSADALLKALEKS